MVGSIKSHLILNSRLVLACSYYSLIIILFKQQSCGLLVSCRDTGPRLMEVYSTTSSYPLKRDYNVASFCLLSPSPSLVLHRLKALLSRIPVRLYQRGWESAGLIEAEN